MHAQRRILTLLLSIVLAGMVVCAVGTTHDKQKQKIEDKIKRNRLGQRSKTIESTAEKAAAADGRNTNTNTNRNVNVHTNEDPRRVLNAESKNNNHKEICNQICTQYGRPQIKVSGNQQFQRLVKYCVEDLYKDTEDDDDPPIEECPEDLKGIPLNCWNVSSVTNMEYAFYFHETFNEPLDCWDVSNVQSMKDMFQNATAFNQPLDNWNVSSVTNMRYMFRSSPAFNQPLNDWDVSNVPDMKSMFYNATSFNQCLNRWAYFAPYKTELRYFFELSGCSNTTTPDPSNPHPWCQTEAENCPRIGGECADHFKTYTIRKGLHEKGRKITVTCAELATFGNKKRKRHCIKARPSCPSACQLRCTCVNKLGFVIKNKGNHYKGLFKCKNVGASNKQPECTTVVRNGKLVRDYCPKTCNHCVEPITKPATKNVVDWTTWVKNRSGPKAKHNIFS